MKYRIVLFLSLCVVLLTVACGGSEAAPPPAEPPAGDTSLPNPTEPNEEEVAADNVALEPDAQTAATDTGCEEYFRFCTTGTLSGTIEATAAGGVGANIETCAAWAAPGEARVLELPMMLAAGEAQVTVALTAISAYTGPGTYELVAVTAEETATHQSVVNVMESARLAGYPHISFTTQSRK